MKETSSLGDLFLFRESEKRLKTTRGGSFFVNVLRAQKSDKSILDTFLLVFLTTTTMVSKQLKIFFIFEPEHEKVKSQLKTYFSSLTIAQKGEMLVQYHLTIFSELKDQLEKCSRYPFHFLMSLQRTMLKMLFHGFTSLKLKR